MRFEKKTLRPCSPAELENWKGKLCYRYCAKKKFLSKSCKRYTLEVYDFIEVQKKLIDAGFIVIDEDRFNI